MYHDGAAITKVNEKLSYLFLFFENLIFPLSTRKKVLFMLGDLKNKTVLEYGCSIGTLTRKLAKKVLPNGKVYAFDHIEHNVNVANKHLKRNKHVSVSHHANLEQFKTKVKMPLADVLVSAGSFSYLQNPQQVLKHLGEKVKRGGRIVFLDYDNFFYLLPNVAWLSDDKKLKRMFKEAGFKIQIVKKRRLFWQNIFIHGEKV